MTTHPIDLTYILSRIEDIGASDLIYTNSRGDTVCQYDRLRRQNPDLDIDRILALYSDNNGSWPAIGREYGEYLANARPWECGALPEALYGCMNGECRDKFTFPAEDLIAWGGSPGYPAGFYCVPENCIQHAKDDFYQCYMLGWKPGPYGWRPRLDEWTPGNVLPSDDQLAAWELDVEQAIRDNTGPNLVDRTEHSRRVALGEEERSGMAWEYAGNIMGPLYCCQYGDCDAYRSIMASYLVWFGSCSAEPWNAGYAPGWYCHDHIAVLRDRVNADHSLLTGPTLQDESVRRKDILWNGSRIMDQSTVA